MGHFGSSVWLKGGLSSRCRCFPADGGVSSATRPSLTSTVNHVKLAGLGNTPFVHRSGFYPAFLEVHWLSFPLSLISQIFLASVFNSSFGEKRLIHVLPSQRRAWPHFVASGLPQKHQLHASHGLAEASVKTRADRRGGTSQR